MREPRAFPEAGDWAWRWFCFLLLLGAILIPIALAGCGSLQGSYVEADDRTRAAVAPVFLQYSEADPELTEEERERRRRLVRSWEARIREGRRADDEDE